MTPTTPRNSPTIGKATFKVRHFSAQLYILAGGARVGSSRTSTMTVRMIVKATTTLGMTPAMKSRPRFTSAISPYKTMATLGGISMPRVPEIATTP